MFNPERIPPKYLPGNSLPEPRPRRPVAILASGCFCPVISHDVKRCSDLAILMHSKYRGTPIHDVWEVGEKHVPFTECSKRINGAEFRDIGRHS
jgi:hypothetical protein